MTIHVSPGIQIESPANKDQPNGYAGLDASSLLKTSELPPSLVRVGAAAPGSGSTGDYFIVRSDGTVARFKPLGLNVEAWGAVGDTRPVTVSITGTAITGTGFTALDGSKKIAIDGTGAPLSTGTLSSTLSTAAPIIALPMSPLANAMPPGDIKVVQGGNNQTFHSTTGAVAGATSITVDPQTPNFAYTSAATVSSPPTRLVTTVTFNSSTSLTAAVAATTNQVNSPAYLGTDDTSAWAGAIAAAGSSQPVEFPKPSGPTGFNSLVTSTLTLPSGGYLTIRGSGANTNIVSAVNGPLLQNGSYDGQAFDANDYSGPQSFRLENVRLVAVAGTALANGQGNYGPGSIAIQDWRGGNLQLDNAYIQGFDFPFWGIESDLNSWHDLTVVNTHSGAYLGPRSDQLRCTGSTYFIFCDRAIDIDGAWGATFEATNFVDNGATGINPIRIRSQWTRGAHGVSFDNCWFEHLIGVSTLEAFIEFAVGDSVASPVSDGLTITNPVILTNASGGVHMQYLVKTGNCDNVTVELPQGIGAYGLIDAIYFHVDTVKAPRLYLSSIQQAGSVTQPNRVVLGSGAAVAGLTRLDWTGGGLGVADGQTSGTTVGRAQIQFIPNLNFPQIRFVQAGGAVTWQIQVSITDAAPKLRFLPPSGGGELHIQDKSAVDHLLFTDAQDGIYVGASGHKLAFYGTAPISKPSAVGGSPGYVAGATTATFHSDDTYTGNAGATAYTINGVVAALKSLGLLTP